jgi:P27 family predicted phage terminase small subunit
MTRRKPPSKRQGRGTRDMAVVPRSERDVPVPAESLPAPLKARWYTLWNSPLGAAWSADTDTLVLRRLFSLYKLRAESLAAVERDGLVVVGSKGQPVDHPLARRLATIDSEIRQLEDRVGLNPRARLNLGLEGLRLQDGIRGLSRVDDDDMDDEDPRLEVVK